MTETPIITRVLNGVHEIAASQWNALLAQQSTPTPFMQHAYLHALQHSGSATARTGWQAQFITLWQDEQLLAACPLYLKSHSWGEYVFDMAWARAYHEHGLAYYPKATIAVPFTPVPGSRLLAVNHALRVQLVRAVQLWCSAEGISSAHVLFGDAADQAACAAAGWMPRQGVQFHWHNQRGAMPEAQSVTPQRFADFEDFLSQLQQSKRKKIRQERQRVAQAGVRFTCLEGDQITPADWDFFYACYARTYAEHHNAPYLTRDFFAQLARQQAAHWVLFIAERQGRRIASSLIAVQTPMPTNSDLIDTETLMQRLRQLSKIMYLWMSQTHQPHPLNQKLLPMAATGALWNAWIACTLKPATTSLWSGALHAALRALKAVHRENTKWHAPCCPPPPAATTGWQSRPLRRQ